MTDTKALLAKLTAVESGPGQPDYGGVTSWYRNPEGPEAATLIEALLLQADKDAEALRPFAAVLEERGR